MKRKISFLALAFMFSTLCSFAQVVIKGKVIDQDTKEPLVGVTVFAESSKTGIATDLDGSFTLRIPSLGGDLTFSYLGYTDVKIKAKTDVGTIEMASSAIGLNDVVVTSSVAIRRKTPVALSVIEPELLEAKLSTQEFPEILKSTPGIYATKQGGGFGDSRVNLRGFETENIAVMINGVPMNEMEWGGLYWSNWSGLSDVTRSMQVQRGLGASKVSAPSVGGSINIVTNSTDAKKGGSISYAMGNDGYNKIAFSVSTGLQNGWAVSLLGSKTWGDGYIQGTDFEGYSYFLNISKQINDKHTLSYTLFGAPQKHNKRTDDMLISEWQSQPNKYRYNATYGFDMNGQRKTSTLNVYHKPQMSLNHMWAINDKSSLSTSIYASLGRGYGYAGQGRNINGTNYRYSWFGTSKEGVINNEYRTLDGTFDYGAIYKMNQESITGSNMVMSKSINDHDWYGLISTYTTRIGENIDLYGGIDFRYYKGIHKNKIVDLYGGEYYLDDVDRKNVGYKKGDEEWINKKLKVGDVVYRDYDGYVVQEGAFAQAEYNKDALSVFVAGSLSNSTYWRYDRFYYDKGDRKSKTANFLGGNIKGGANYNIDKNHNVFGNIGYISRAPFFSNGVFLQKEVSNEINKDARNEKVFSLELGYGYRSPIISANLNIYSTSWMDKSMARSVTFNNPPDGGEDRGVINMTGVDALHQGIELDFILKPVRDLEITGMLSLGDWKWNSNTTGYLYSQQGQPLTSKGAIASGIGAEDHAKAVVNLKDVKVGNSAQTTFALGANYKLLKDFRVGLDYTYYARNYSKFTIQGSDLEYDGKTNTYTTPWRIPSSGQLDFNMNYRFQFAGLKATLFANVNNILNNKYIVDAQDGVINDPETGRVIEHTAESAQVYYAFGRSYSVRLKINF
ncbi:TonB-dependent receptor [Dysgonomonas sp. 520]|uniref:TonB-dependent receptor n=1 Tax=Dysgonomonas sp. 520 TaxID=2302931 RepID=UPI0013CFFA85|nr:TonB-dependent receptor [Dysgonomonas sp. 520]NDW10581.1 TonB-dependent receptor [Dysgonomonas sp. 520]